MTKYEFADALREGIRNSGCEGVTQDIQFAVHNLSMHERGKLAALLGVYGYAHISDVTAATGLTLEQVTADARGMTMRRPTTDGDHGSSVTTPKAASMIKLLGGQTYKGVAMSRGQYAAINRLYGFKPEKPNQKPPPPEAPKAEDFGSGYEYRIALQNHEVALKRHANWQDPRAMHQAAADRNALRHAEADGLRLLVWISKFVGEGQDPLKVLVQLAADGGWDVDPEDVDWAEEEDEES